MTGGTRRTWAAFMEDALYDPERGFFSRSPVGAEFATAPHLSPVFASCVARLLAACLEQLGEPFSFVELAASDGTLAEQIAMSAPSLAERVDYAGIDRDEAALARLRGRMLGAWRGVRAVASLDGVAPIRGLVFANELFDNVPFHRLRGRADGTIVEILVERIENVLGERTENIPVERTKDVLGKRAEGILGKTSEGVLVEIEAEPAPQTLAAASRLPRAGEEIVASPQARALLRDALTRLETGWLVAIDYGFSGGAPIEPVRGYRGHVRVDPLREPEGSCDITGPVDFDALLAEALEADARARLTDQRTLLAALGFERFVAQLDEQQVAAQQAGDVGRAMLLEQVRRGAGVLVDADELGGFGVLIAAVGDVPDLPVRLG